MSDLVLVVLRNFYGMFMSLCSLYILCCWVRCCNLCTCIVESCAVSDVFYCWVWSILGEGEKLTNNHLIKYGNFSQSKLNIVWITCTARCRLLTNTLWNVMSVRYRPTASPCCIPVSDRRVSTPWPKTQSTVCDDFTVYINGMSAD